MSRRNASTIVKNLFKKPKKDSGVNMPKFRSYPDNFIHQADILFLPQDGKYRYALVVVDIGTRIVDAEPMKNKTPKDVIRGMEKIYDRGILELPSRRIDTDSGSEFKGDFKKWLKKHKLITRTAKPNRHRQMAVVERKNQSIGKKLFMRMIEQEILTGETSREWVDDLPNVISEINELPHSPKKVSLVSNEPLCKGDSCKLLSQGTVVRVALDAPRDFVTEKRLHGGFRDSDIRWDHKPRKIMETIIQPGMPPLYLINNEDGGVDRSAAYTKNQLQVIKDNEQLP